MQVDHQARVPEDVVSCDPKLVGGHRTAFYTIAGRARIPGRFAIDFVPLSAAGTLENAMPRPADWNGRGSEVLAVAHAPVVAALDDTLDNPDPAATVARTTFENASGNYVTLDLGHGRFAFYEHLRYGSIVVKPGKHAKAGQVIARRGFSGSSSIGLHLRFHVTEASSLLGAEGLPFTFGAFDHLGVFASIDALKAGNRWTPKPDDWRGIRRAKRPSANAVIRFP